MSKRNLTVLEVMRRRLRVDPELAKHPEARSNVLSRLLSLQRRNLSDDDMDFALGAVLLRLDLVLGSGNRSAEAIGLRVRCLEQLNKCRSALRRARRGSTGGMGGASALWDRPLRIPPPRRPEQKPADEPAKAEDNATEDIGGSDG